jgi:two-component system chemotaxis sensor kinase CheA
MSDLDDFKATYFDECSELLLELEEQFAAIEAGDSTSDRLNAVFRAIHSIKGGGGAFGFSALVGFAHAYETLLDHVRDGKVDLTEPVVALCIRANDLVADFVKAAKDGVTLAEGYGSDEKAQFDVLTAAEGEEETLEEFDLDFVPVMVQVGPKTLPADPSTFTPDAAADHFDVAPLSPSDLGWLVRFVPQPELYARANDPLLLIRELGRLGAVEIRARVDDVPLLGDFEGMASYCAWDIFVSGDKVTRAAIEEIFEFVEGLCELDLREASRHELGPLTLPPQAAEVFDDGPSLADLAAEIKPKAPTAGQAVEPVAPPPEGAAEGDRRNGIHSIRVDLDKIDRVVNMVGELVITQSMLTQQMDESLRAQYQELVRGLEVLAQTTRGLQDSVMSIRAQPVKTVFSRMPRLVRELAVKTGKKIRLETVGENTEIDKTIIEQLSDPLTHMIRNSADHGIEGPEKRLGLGKSDTGVIRLSAEQSGGNIIIAVEDDGGGINRDRVLQVARERGVVGADQQLTDDQTDQLIFAPGFSTASEVSDLSGRGVGMDVVLSNIKKIGGSVQVKSWPGKGTRMTLRLPLTLAVLDVMLVTVAGSPYVIPLSTIVETMQCMRANFSRMPTGGQVLKVRGEYVQVVDLAQRFAMPTSVDDASRFVVLCEAEGGQKIALVVDGIIGQQQVVIKSLEENFQSIEGIAGVTILGDGNVALIVDVQGIKVSSGLAHKSAA